ncbi:hypothetical protein K469DRAFT_769075, partial [Zopfia rhizophila CBS 207.26]
NALQVASERGHDRIVKLLLDKGADVNAQGGDFDNALQAVSREAMSRSWSYCLTRAPTSTCNVESMVTYSSRLQQEATSIS